MRSHASALLLTGGRMALSCICRAAHVQRTLSAAVLWRAMPPLPCSTKGVERGDRGEAGGLREAHARDYDHNAACAAG